MNKNNKTSAKISKVEKTNEKISGRGGLTLFLLYVENIMFYPLVSKIFGKLSRSGKGLQLFQFIKQILAHFIDGTDMSISSFDRKKEDVGYTAVLENKMKDMASSHQIKRFFCKLMLNNIGNNVYRKILHQLFIWRLKIEKPKCIELGIDTMVMDNDDAKKREGSEPTYKKKKGFQPLHISWGPYLVDVLFRSGSKHSNHGTDYIDTIRDIVNLIRTKYCSDIPIILRADSGFLDQKAFTYFEEELKILYVVSGKMYEGIKEYISGIDYKQYGKYTRNGIWSYLELGNKLKSWKKFRRCIFTTLETDEKGQFILEFAKTDSIIYTNICQDTELTEQLKETCKNENIATAESIISLAHGRGADELIHRSIKELATKEQLPFEKMGMNCAYYYLLVIAHFLFEAYKRDVTADVLPIVSYPNTFRRNLIDFAVKIVSHGGQIIMKIAKAIYDKLRIEELWKLCQSPPVIVWS